jgi:hypothetical protein
VVDRLSILFYLCQQKLDSESPDFVADYQSMSSTKPPKVESQDINPESKTSLESFNIGLLKSLSSLKSDVNEYLLAGEYFYFPFFNDTRLYRQSHDRAVFELISDDYDYIILLLNSLQENLERVDCIDLHSKLT